MRKTSVVVALLCAAGLAWAGGEPWEKEFKSWSKDDAQKVLNDSPWAKRVAVAESYSKSTDKSDGGQNTASPLERGDLRASEFATVVWWSAHTPRRAYLRQIELGGRPITPEQYKEFADVAMDAYVVAIWDTPQVLALAAKLDPETLRKAAWLESPRTREKVMAGEAQVVKTGSGKPDRIVFAFPKEAGGQPLAAAEDKRLVFKWRIPRDAKEKPEDAKGFEAQFQPAKMTALGQPDM